MARPDDDDLDAWLDGLRGRAAPGAAAATREQARAQRAAVTDAHAARQAAQPDDPQELQRLLFRLRREGLLGGERASAATRLRLPMAAAAALALGLAITMIGPALWHADDAPVLRGGASVQVIDVDAATLDDTVQRLQSALQGVGAVVSVSDSVVDPDGRATREVAATVPAPRIGDAARALAPFGLAPPAADGTLRVELRARTPSQR